MNQLGYYGKTPQRGDFVRFNLPQSFIKVWDDWLQQVMINGESQGQAWHALYAQAPAYRFVLSSGIAGNTPWMGILKASRDKVGRRFPFCLAMSLSEQALPCVSASTQSLWFDEAESLLERVLASEFSFDDLQGELTAMAKKHAAVVPPAGNPITQSNKHSGDAVTISAGSADALRSNQVLPALLDTVLQQTLGEFSLWMAGGSIETTVINSGLPIDKAGLALFDSNWDVASTAIVKLALLPAGLPQVETLHAATEADTSLPDHDAKPSPASDESGLSVEPSTRDSSQQPHKPEVTPEEVLDPAKFEQVPSADDWAALEDFADSSQTSAKVIVPVVEKLELDEDDMPDAPWER